MLEKKYPRMRRYGLDTIDSAAPPYFFVELVPLTNDRETKNMLHRACSIKVNYVQRVPDEMDMLTKSQEIFEALGLTFPVGSRKFTPTQYTHSFTGQHKNALQISFRLDWYEDTEDRSGEKIEHAEVRVKG